MKEREHLKMKVAVYVKSVVITAASFVSSHSNQEYGKYT